MAEIITTKWQLAQVKSPRMEKSISVILAKDIPYVSGANRLQNLSIYLPQTDITSKLVGQLVTSIPTTSTGNSLPQCQVHVHGGAWRDPQLLSSSIEAAVAHSFSASIPVHPITAIASINYTLSPFPTHPTLPYEPDRDNHIDPAREAMHPMHVRDVLRGLAFLKSLGITDNSYVLSGHSAGAYLAFESVLRSPQYYGSDGMRDPPRPAVLIGLNGLYDLPDLVNNLGATHDHLKDVYEDLIQIAFGTDQTSWPAVSPARCETNQLARKVSKCELPKVVLIDQSIEDQLVPTNQADKMEATLRKVPGIDVIRGFRCTSKHAAPWEEGYMIWESVQDALSKLAQV